MSAIALFLIVILTLVALIGMVVRFMDKDFGGMGIFLTASLVGLGFLYLGSVK